MHTREEVMWKQRSRIEWLKHGDRNSKFFHATASQRRQKNRIGGLVDELGVWHDDQESTERLILDYFKSIYSSNQPTSFEESLNAMEERVTPVMNDELQREFMVVEVWNALKQMHPIKAPGPDGMSLVFYQKYWNIVGPYITNCVLQALNTGTMPMDINKTYICPYPKN